MGGGHACTLWVFAGTAPGNPPLIADEIGGIPVEEFISHCGIYVASLVIFVHAMRGKRGCQAAASGERMRDRDDKTGKRAFGRCVECHLSRWTKGYGTYAGRLDGTGGELPVSTYSLRRDAI